MSIGDAKDRVAAVGLAVADGKLKLEDPVLKFFPDEAPTEISDHLRAMTVKDLLTMTCGHETEVKLSMTDTVPWVRAFLAHPVTRRSLALQQQLHLLAAQQFGGMLANEVVEVGGHHGGAIDHGVAVQLRLVALVLAAVQDQPAEQVAQADIAALLEPFDLKNQLSSNRTQGVPNMIALVRETAGRLAAL